MNIEQETYLQWVRKLAHDIQGPLGNATAFTQMAMQANVVGQDQSQDLQQHALKLALPALVQLQKLTRMWSATYQMLSGEIQPFPERITTQSVFELAYSHLGEVMRKKQVHFECQSNLPNILADKELFDLMVHQFFMLAIVVGKSGGVMQVTSPAEDALLISIPTDGDYPALSERLSFKGESIEDLPLTQPDGILKPLSFGCYFLAVSAKVHELKMDVQEDGDTFSLQLSGFQKA